jgi:hypothetical protein
MTTNRPHPLRAAALAAVATAAVALAAPGRATAAYGWPVKPFHVQHPVRGYFGDPRGSRPDLPHSLHFGIDVSAANGTPVYAVVSGSISRHPLHPDAILVTSGSLVLEYWHIVPARTSGWATAYRTILGTVEKPWAHVHLAERTGSTFVNPLRPGGTAPYRDPTRPTIEGVGVDDGRLVVDAYDTTPLAVPAPWSGKPVSPALVEWRTAPGRWQVAADFRTVLPPSYGAIYSRRARQNLVAFEGRYLFALGAASSFAGTTELQVRAADTAGNAAVATFRRGCAPGPASHGACARPSWRRVETEA